jgi:hypothetical protein
VPLTIGTLEPGDEPAQLHQIADTVEARLRRAQEETTQATQALTQVQGVLMEQRNTSERENIALQEKWDADKVELQKSKEQLLAEKLEIKELVNRALRSVTSHRSTDRRMSSTVGGTTRRSNSEAPATHCRSRASRST